MSVIAARKLENRIDMASDTQTTAAGRLAQVSKIHKISDEFMYGTSGYAWIDTAFQYFLNKREDKTMESNELFVFNMMVEFKKFLKEIAQNEDTEAIKEQQFLFAIMDKLFYALDLFVIDVGYYCAIGSGEDVATGAMAMGATVIQAVQIAMDNKDSCGGIIETKSTYFKPVNLF